MANLKSVLIESLESALPAAAKVGPKVAAFPKRLWAIVVYRSPKCG
jgi:hypothetical protein